MLLTNVKSERNTNETSGMAKSDLSLEQDITEAVKHIVKSALVILKIFARR